MRGVGIKAISYQHYSSCTDKLIIKRKCLRMVEGRLGCMRRGGVLEKHRKLLGHREVKVSRQEDSEDTLR
jgi:hypothetical protein